LVVVLAASYELRFGYLIGLVAITYFCWDYCWGIVTKANKKLQLTKTVHLILFLAVIAGSLMFWLLPTFLWAPPTRSVGTGQQFWLSVLSYDKMIDAMLLKYKIFWIFNYFPDNNLFNAWIIVPVCAFLPLLFKNLESLKKTAYLSSVAIASFFIVNGVNAPLGQVNTWLYLCFPGFVGFRVQMYFLFTAFLSISPLFGLGVTAFHGIFNKIKSSIMRKCVKTCVGCILIIIILIPYYGLFLYDIPNLDTLDTAEKRVPDGIRDLVNWMRSNPSNKLYRTYYFTDYAGRVEIFDQERQGMMGVPQSGLGGRNQYISIHTSFARESALKGSTSSLGKLIGLTNTKYIVPYSASLHDYSIGTYPPPNIDFTVQTHALDSQKDLSKRSISDHFWIYETNESVPRFFIPEKNFLVIGGRNALLGLSSFGMDFRKCGIFFADQLKGWYPQILDRMDAIIFYDSDFDDLILSSVNESIRINLFKCVPETSRVPLELNLEYAGTSFNDLAMLNGTELSTQIRVERDDQYEIWVRGMIDRNASQLNITFDSNEVDRLTMNSGIKGIKWQKAGSMYINEGEHRIVLRGSNNLLDQIALVPTSAIQNQIALMSHAISHKEIITVLKTGRLIGGKGNWSYEQNRDGTEGFVSMANG
jgi:hypothetical protein